MEKLTAVEWLIEQLYKHEHHIDVLDVAKVNGYFKQAKALEYTLEDIKNAYNYGYLDCECNHINDAENYANELFYIKTNTNDEQD